MSDFTIELPPPEQLSQMIARSPRAYQYQRMLGELLRHEQEKRLRFHETLAQYEGHHVEFIYGEVIEEPMPVKKTHLDIVKLLLKLLDTFVQLYALGYVAYEKALVSLERNDYEPDICFFNKAKAADFQPTQTVFPVPDFAVEVLSPESQKRDCVTKFDDYASNGVSEYWIIDPETETIEQYVLEQNLERNRYRLVVKTGAGTIRSVTIQGFEVPVRAIFDQQENLATLRKML
jgi:Uma2 family endonuclease